MIYLEEMLMFRNNLTYIFSNFLTIIGIGFILFDLVYGIFIEGSLYFTFIGDVWFFVHQTSLQLIQPAIERHIAVWLWDPIILYFLQLPIGIFILFNVAVIKGFRFFWVKNR